jgi:Fur family peroxide stress response transcriptional regulator
MRGRRLEEIAQRLRSGGHRMTPQRMAILEAILDGAHPSAEDIFKAVAGRYPTLSLATVYKTLALLKEEGEVLELGFGGHESRYDAVIPDPHPHLICTRCGEIVDPPFMNLDAAVRVMAERTGFRVDSHRLDFFGLCPRCQAEARSGEKGGK